MLSYGFDMRSKKIRYFWLGLSLQAGLMNAGAWLACGRYASHLTGTATSFGVEAALSHWGEALSLLSVPAFFLGGAMLSGFLVDFREEYGRRPRYDVALAIMFGLLALVAVLGSFDQFGDFGRAYRVENNYVFLVLLAITCGLQNALFTRRWGTTIRTTHITGTTTDLGIGLVKMLYLSREGQPMGSLLRINLLRLGSVAFFILGSLLGALLHLRYGYSGFAVTALLCAHFFVIEKLTPTPSSETNDAMVKRRRKSDFE